MVILFGDSDDGTGVILTSAHGERVFVIRVLRFGGTRVDLFSLEKKNI